MSKERNKKRKDVPELTIFEERKAQKISAHEVLKIAKEQEAKKLKNGFHYEMQPDGKTHLLIKPKK